ncbi:unnamed protein product [Prorocentrum cordatum]|uniref:Uncharacterized protein n=1 Tax=Prorocentrum cordatum TaxID=2364126 RepID=A0ABN9SLS9_9DINO|nr:unnamed protein product [Polarella glacialis]
MDLFPQRSQRHAMRRRALPGRRGRRRPLAHGWRPCANLAALARQREGEGKAGRRRRRRRRGNGAASRSPAPPRWRAGPGPTGKNSSRLQPQPQQKTGRGARARRARAQPPPRLGRGGGVVVVRGGGRPLSEAPGPRDGGVVGQDWPKAFPPPPRRPSVQEGRRLTWAWSRG